jgi:hypothetical protein
VTDYRADELTQAVEFKLRTDEAFIIAQPKYSIQYITCYMLPLSNQISCYLISCHLVSFSSLLHVISHLMLYHYISTFYCHVSLSFVEGPPSGGRRSDVNVSGQERRRTHRERSD